MNSAVKHLKRISAAAKIASFFDFMSKVSSLTLTAVMLSSLIKAFSSVKNSLVK